MKVDPIFSRSYALFKSFYDIVSIKIIDKKRVARKASYLVEARGELARCTGLHLIYNEISILRQLYHRNIVLLFEVK